MFGSDLERYRIRESQCRLEIFIRALYNHPAIVGIFWYRLSRYLWLRKSNPVIFILYVLARGFYPIVRMVSGLELSPRTDIGPGLWIGHAGPCIIHPATRAGKNLTIHHGVTIGESKSGVPSLGNNVSIGVNATLVGGIEIGDNAIIGAGAVVVKSVPEGAVAIGVPARIKSEVQNRATHPGMLA